MKMKSLSTILRYGGLLAVFLIAAETAKRSYISSSTSLDLYLGSVALVFLILGGMVAFRLRRPPAPAQEKPSKQFTTVNAAGFSRREADVLLFLCHGYPNSEIAQQLGITENTVKTHLKNIYSKLGVTNRTQAAAEVKMLNIVE